MFECFFLHVCVCLEGFSEHLYAWNFSHMFVYLVVFFFKHLYVWMFSNILACQPPLCSAGWKERLGLPLLGNDNPSSTSQIWELSPFIFVFVFLFFYLLLLPLLGNDNLSSTSRSFASYENCPLSFASSLQPTRILPLRVLGLSMFVFRSEKNCLFVSNQEQWALHVTSLAKCSSTAPLCSCGPDWSNHRPTHSVPGGPE